MKTFYLLGSSRFFLSMKYVSTCPKCGNDSSRTYCDSQYEDANVWGECVKCRAKNYFIFTFQEERMIQRDAEINTRILVSAQNDAEIVERLKKRIEELTLDENPKYGESDHEYDVLKELQGILGE